MKIKLKKSSTSRTQQKSTKAGVFRFQKGNKYGTLHKGVPAKFTTLKNSFIEVYEMLGGTQGLYDWVNANRYGRKHFYGWVVKLLPRELNVGDSSVAPNDLSNLKDNELDDIIAQHIKS